MRRSCGHKTAISPRLHTGKPLSQWWVCGRAEDERGRTRAEFAEAVIMPAPALQLFHSPPPKLNHSSLAFSMAVNNNVGDAVCSGNSAILEAEDLLQGATAQVIDTYPCHILIKGSALRPTASCQSGTPTSLLPAEAQD